MNHKHAFDDIIPPGGSLSKRSIRNIPINREKKPNKIDELLEETEEMRSEYHTPPPTYIPPTSLQNTPRSHRTLLLTIGVIVLLLLGATGFALMRSSVVDITLKTETIPVEFLATSTSDAMSASNTLPYKLLPVSKEGTKEVSATGPSTTIEKRASGNIIIYNNSAASQQLIATTRFATPEGLEYRIDKPITIPAKGSIEAVVYADQPGESYNVGMKDFTIPGFKGTPKYEQFYARSKTALAGGFIGTMPQVSDADLKAANDELETSLKAQAVADIQLQKSADSVFFPTGSITSFTSSVAPGESGKAVVTGKLTLEALLFDRATVEKAIADTKNGQQYRYDNLESLAVIIQNPTPVTSFMSSPVLSLKFAGTLTTGQSFDEEALRRALAGKSKAQLAEILRMYPEITQAEATVRPFWKSSFPENPEKININITQ
jgi:hypothetical protein